MFAMRMILEHAIDLVDSALESPKSQLSNAPKIKSISHLVDDISQNENGSFSTFSPEFSIEKTVQSKMQFLFFLAPAYFFFGTSIFFSIFQNPKNHFFSTKYFRTKTTLTTFPLSLRPGLAPRAQSSSQDKKGLDYP